MISIIIPTWNNYSQLGDCIQSINDHSRGYNYEILVIDNGPRPRGYVGPANKGLRAAKDSDILMVVNDDALVTVGWLPPLIREWQKGTNIFCPFHPNEKDMKLVGWFICFSKEGYERYGGFDPRFVLWCGDIDLCKRVERSGDKIVKVMDSSVEHQYSKTTERPEISSVVTEWQLNDIDAYKDKWNSDPNVDKVCS